MRGKMPIRVKMILAVLFCTRAEWISNKDLCKATGLYRGNLHRCMNKLKHLGLVKRQIDLMDTRHALWRLAEA